MPPSKKYRDIQSLSGGEKSIASLALLLAMHACSPPPFFILDEVDAALDNVNVQKVAAYISRRAAALASGDAKRKGVPALQFLVISLKDAFYCHAQALIGIFRDNERDSSCSRTLELVARAGKGGGGAAAVRAAVRQPGGDDEDVEDEE